MPDAVQRCDQARAGSKNGKSMFLPNHLTLKAPITARQRFHMKNQALFSSKDKSKKLNVVCYKFCVSL